MYRVFVGKMIIKTLLKKTNIVPFMLFLVMGGNFSTALLLRMPLVLVMTSMGEVSYEDVCHIAELWVLNGLVAASRLTFRHS